MRIVVLVKQVPRDMNVTLNRDHTVNREDIEKITNPADVSALALAAGVKKRCGGEIVCMTMGPKSAADCLREAAVNGADELYHVCDPAFAGSDTLVTARVLSTAIRMTGGADLILCGRHAVDGETGQVGPEISVMLGVSCITHITEITDINPDVLICNRFIGYETQLFSVKMPALATVCEFFVAPTLPSMAVMRRAKALPVKTLTAKDLDLAGMSGRESSPTRVERVFIKERKRRKAAFFPAEDGVEKIAGILYDGNNRQ